jgi:hypothetical protein
MSVQTQTTRLGTPEGIANFAASFGATIGQNGCAGIYPAMLAVMIAPTVGVDPFTIGFIAPLLAIITIGSRRRGRRRRRRHLCGADRAVVDEPAGGPGRPADLDRTADRHGPHRAQRQRLRDGRCSRSRVMGETDQAVFNSDAEPPLDSERKAA